MSDTSGLDNFWVMHRWHHSQRRSKANALIRRVWQGTASAGDGTEPGRSTATITSLMTATHDGRRFLPEDAPVSSTRWIRQGRVSRDVLTADLGSAASCPVPCSLTASTGRAACVMRVALRACDIQQRVTSSFPPNLHLCFRQPNNSASSSSATDGMFTAQGQSIIIDHQPAACSGACVGCVVVHRAQYKNVTSRAGCGGGARPASTRRLLR